MPHIDIEERRAYHRKYREKHKDKINLANRTNGTNIYRPASRLRRLQKLAGRLRPIFCEVCGDRASNNGLCWDHDHATGKFRGWLCQNCNWTLGNAKDRAWVLRKLADYLDRGGSDVMLDSDLDAIFKVGNQESFYAGLRALYDAGYAAAAGTNLATSVGDPSQTTSPPTNDVQANNINTP